jgi:hypothetical protein
MTEVLELLLAETDHFAHYAPYKLIYAHMLAEVGLIDKATAYVERIAANRANYGSLASNLYFISTMRYLHDRLSVVKT